MDTLSNEVNKFVGIEVCPFYVPEKSCQNEGIYFFAYYVRITNNFDKNIQLLNREWIIRDGKGNEEKVSGEGVVGKQPVIAPGETFEYTSFCPLSTTTGNMRGKYFMQIENGESVWVDIPLFFLRQDQRIDGPLTSYVSM